MVNYEPYWLGLWPRPIRGLVCQSDWKRRENNKIVIFKSPKSWLFADEMNMIVSKKCCNVRLDNIGKPRWCGDAVIMMHKKDDIYIMSETMM